ncbi:MAG: hypothetical protein KDJ75_10360 [Alphaproteobacteria bacterium]|nr:hypothetical protein [Alphaproteobacteria bacterium]
MIPASKINQFLDRRIVGQNEAVWLYDPEHESPEAKIVDQLQEDSQALFVTVEALDNNIAGFIDPHGPDDGDISAAIGQAEVAITEIMDLVRNLRKLALIPQDLPPKLHKLIGAK